jgi:hypothetical protein
MKLTQRQIELRKSFRENIIKCWKKQFKMLRIVYMVALDVDGYIQSKEDKKNGDYNYINKLVDELQIIPSIGYFTLTNTTSNYLGAYYPKIFNMLFDGVSEEKCIQMFRIEKKSKPIKPTIDKEIKDNHIDLKKQMKNVAIIKSSFKKSRWSKSDWSTVK